MVLHEIQKDSKPLRLQWNLCTTKIHGQMPRLSLIYDAYMVCMQILLSCFQQCLVAKKKYNYERDIDL